MVNQFTTRMARIYNGEKANQKMDGRPKWIFLQWRRTDSQRTDLWLQGGGGRKWDGLGDWD